RRARGLGLGARLGGGLLLLGLLRVVARRRGRGLGAGSRRRIRPRGGRIALLRGVAGRVLGGLFLLRLRGAVLVLRPRRLRAHDLLDEAPRDLQPSVGRAVDRDRVLVLGHDLARVDRAGLRHHVVGERRRRDEEEQRGRGGTN